MSSTISNYRKFDFYFIFNEWNFRRIPNVETYTMSSLYPDTLYYIWLAARSQRGEGATSPAIPVRTKQYGKNSNSFASKWNFCKATYIKTKKRERKDLIGQLIKFKKKETFDLASNCSIEN